ncbi:MAG: TIR domain-containing protein [Nitrospiraceae bacterium]|nr:TIR domain-containing protein [Nitrospiraceae bacterium]
MPNVMCPKCNSTDVMFSKKKQIYICEEEECRHEFIPEKKITPLRIFISYGRDEYAVLAKRLRDDLAKRGHDVWFDSERLKEGGDWEQYIDEGLNHVAKDITTGRVVFIMTPHSTRRPDGYCLNELARALSKSLPIVPVMLVYSEPPLSICRLQYLDMQDSYPPDEKTVTYEQRFERLISALEENRVDFEGFQSKLFAALDPIKFHADIQKLLRDFTGRKWVIEEVDKWYQDPNGSKIFWLTGAPGTGKSAVAAWIRDNRREIAAYHFCDINSEEKRDAGKLVRSVAFQLSTQLQQYEEKLKGLPVQEIANEYHEAYTLFDKLIVQPLTENFPDPGRTVVVLIDALDEATFKGNNEIVRFLSRCADKTPPWLRFLVTSRPEQEITSSLQALSPYLLDTDTEANRNDIREYLKHQLAGITKEQTDRILERSEGIFLYVKHVCDEIRGKRLSLDRIDEFPKGLGDIYKQFFDNRIPPERIEYYNQEVRPLLCAVLASFEPLTLGHLMRILQKKNLMELFDVTDMLGSLFPRTGDTIDDTISPFHRSIKDWITVKASAGIYFIDEKYGHQILAEDGWNQYEAGAEKMDDYSLQWLPGHIAEVEYYGKLVTVLKNFEFMMARVKAGHLERLLADYRELVKELPSDLKTSLRIEEAFFREKAHILRRGNDGWPSYKILVQLAMEHADDSPVTIGAEKYLVEGKVDWMWLRREKRVKHAGIDPCMGVLMEGELSVHGVQVFPDGCILSWFWDGTLRIWSSDGTPLHVLDGHTGRVNGARVLADGRILSWSDDKTLRIWSSDGKPLHVFEGHTNSVIGAFELPDGRIISLSEDSSLQVWASDGKLLHIHTLENTDEFAGARVLPDGRILSWSTKTEWYPNMPKMLIRKSDGSPIHAFEGHAGHVYGTLVLADGRILSWSDDKTLRIWNSDGTPLHVLEEHTSRVFGALELADSRILSWSDDKTLRIWNSDGTPLHVLEGHTDGVSGALVLADGRILSWSWDKTLRIWSSDGTPLHVLEGHTDGVSGALELADGRILSWSWDKTLRIWSSDGTPLHVLEGHTKRVEDAWAFPDGRILSWSWDGTLRIWGLDGPSRQYVLNGHTDTVDGAEVLSDGRILSWSRDGTLRIWDSDGTSLHVLEGDTDGVSGALELADGRILSWSWDGTLRIWDSDGTSLHVLEEHTSRVFGALELADSRILSWSADKTLRIWDSDGTSLHVLEGHTYGVFGALELADGRILSWSRDETLRIWNSDGTPLHVLSGHTGMVVGAEVLSDGRILSWSEDKTLRIWSSDGTPLHVLEGHTEWVSGAQVLADGRIISLSDTWRLFDSDGSKYDVYSYNEALSLFREARELFYGKGNVSCHSGAIAYTNWMILFFHRYKPLGSVYWHGMSRCTARLLKSNGEAIVTQDNGQVCFLKLYDGNRRITLDELEPKLAVEAR